MKGVIIAAGEGSRLRGVSLIKPLAEIEGTPLLEHVARRAVAGGVSELVIITGYEAAKVEDFAAALSDKLALPVFSIRNDNWREGNGGSVLAARKAVSAPFVLMMADHLLDPAIIAGLTQRAPPENGLTLAVDRNLANPLVDLDDVTCVFEQDGSIRRIGKHLENYNAFDTGVFYCQPALFQALQSAAEQGQHGLSAGVQLLADRGRANVYVIGDKFWLDVDDEKMFKFACEALSASPLQN